MRAVTVTYGDGPVVLGQPHSGTYIPADIMARLNQNGRRLADTDWHVDRLYEGLLPNVTIVRANFHRYVIDANRNPSGESLYPGQNTTGLVPLVDFEGEDIWETPPAQEEIEVRRVKYHAAYHAELRAAIERARAAHGVAVLYDCHSIRSELPFLFEGRLPDLNIGTNNGATCAAKIEQETKKLCGLSRYSHVLNGRFRGGWTTRHYGQPETGAHAIQMEIAQANYLETESTPFAYDGAKAEELRALLKGILERIEAIALSGTLNGVG